jgi:hypothetical protein
MLVQQPLQYLSQCVQVGFKGFTEDQGIIYSNKDLLVYEICEDFHHAILKRMLVINE